MDYLSIFLVSFAIALSGALAPGPLLATVIYESPKHGFKTGPLLILGHALLEIAMVAFIILGLNRFVNNPLVFKILTFCGSIILIYFGLRMFLSAPRASLDLKSTPTGSSNLIFAGATVSIANPYWTIWWLSIGLGLVLAAQRQGLIAIGIFFLGHILADLGWYSLVSLMISRTRHFISQKAYRIMLSVCALALIGFGVYFGVSFFSKGQ